MTTITDDWLSGAEVEARVEIRSGRHSATLAPCDVLALVTAHRAALARIAELEAASINLAAMTKWAKQLEAKAAADLADYETSLSTMSAIARRNALEEAAKLADTMGGGLRDDGSTIGMLQDCGKETANILAAAIRSLKDKEPA